MAASVIPAPGTKYGPCKSCKHIDCAESRRMAESICTVCAKPIGYQVRYCRDDDAVEGALAHEGCLILRHENLNPRYLFR